MELVFNSPTWSDSGLPVNDDVDGLVDNDCGCSEPLIPPSVFSAMPVCNVETLPEGTPLVPPVLNYAEISRQNGHSFDRSGLGVPPRVGQYPQDREYGAGAPPRFDDNYEEHLAEQHRENQRRLGLLDSAEEPLTPPSMMAAIIADSRARSRR